MSTSTPSRPAVTGRSGSRPGLADATVARLPQYVRALRTLDQRGVTTVSSEELALAAHVGSATLRKDLSCLGSFGTRGVGYGVAPLLVVVEREIGPGRCWNVAIVGIGSLGHALANHGGFAGASTRVVALFDADPAVVGSTVAGLVVRDAADLESGVAELDVRIGVLAVPGGPAQGLCDRLVTAGVTSLLSFVPDDLAVPEHVGLRSVDLSSELAILAYREGRRAADDGGGRGDETGPAAGPDRSLVGIS